MDQLINFPDGRIVEKIYINNNNKNFVIGDTWFDRQTDKYVEVVEATEDGSMVFVDYKKSEFRVRFGRQDILNAFAAQARHHDNFWGADYGWDPSYFHVNNPDGSITITRR